MISTVQSLNETQSTPLNNSPIQSQINLISQSRIKPNQPRSVPNQPGSVPIQTWIHLDQSHSNPNQTQSQSAPFSLESTRQTVQSRINRVFPRGGGQAPLGGLPPPRNFRRRKKIRNCPPLRNFLSGGTISDYQSCAVQSRINMTVLFSPESTPINAAQSRMKPNQPFGPRSVSNQPWSVPFSTESNPISPVQSRINLIWHSVLNQTQSTHSISFSPESTLISSESTWSVPFSPESTPFSADSNRSAMNQIHSVTNPPWSVYRSVPNQPDQCHSSSKSNSIVNQPRPVQFNPE